jgi:hypothetical protein
LTEKTLVSAAQLSVKYDKPILLDYYNDSINNKACIGLCNNKEKIIIKSKDEYTSPIQNIFKVQNDYITVTENSIYLLSKKIKTKKLNINI